MRSIVSGAIKEEILKNSSVLLDSFSADMILPM